MSSKSKDLLPTPSAPEADRGERIAKVMARLGLGSRRDAEKMIADGRVMLNGSPVTSPATFVQAEDQIQVDGVKAAHREPVRLFLYHKPAGLITTAKDPGGRPTVFDSLPSSLPRLISVGRLDLNTEGLLLLTNDGTLSRALELPSTGLVRSYRVRVHGHVQAERLQKLSAGITWKGVRYGPILAEIEREGGTGHNVWLRLSLREGKNREIRNVMEALGLQVNRLIRTSYGPFELGALKPGTLLELKPKVIQSLLQDQLPGETLARLF